MKRALSISFAVAVLCAALAAAGPTPALAGAPHGSLTKTEYKDIDNWLVEDTKAFGKKGSLKEAVVACNDLGKSTAFLRAIHASCLYELGVLIDVSTLTLLEESCAKRATTTTGTTTTTTPTTTSTTATSTDTTTTATGTTTTPTGTTTTTTGTTTTGTTTPTVNGLTATQVKVFVCLKPLYQTLGQVTTKLHAQDIITRRDGVERGLVGGCLNTMAASTRQLQDEGNMASSASALSAAALKLARVVAGKLAASSVNGYAINTAEYDFNKAYNALGTDSTANKLTTCPHQ